MASNMQELGLMCELAGDAVNGLHRERTMHWTRH
jgi:hypothetical protein